MRRLKSSSFSEKQIANEAQLEMSQMRGSTHTDPIRRYSTKLIIEVGLEKRLHDTRIVLGWSKERVLVKEDVSLGSGQIFARLRRQANAPPLPNSLNLIYWNYRRLGRYEVIGLLKNLVIKLP